MLDKRVSVTRTNYHSSLTCSDDLFISGGSKKVEVRHKSTAVKDSMKGLSSSQSGNVVSSAAPYATQVDLFTPLPFLRHTFCDSLQSINAPLPSHVLTVTDKQSVVHSKSKVTESLQRAKVHTASVTNSVHLKRKRKMVTDNIFQQLSSIKETSLALHKSPPIVTSTSQPEMAQNSAPLDMHTSFYVNKARREENKWVSPGDAELLVKAATTDAPVDINITLNSSHADVMTYLRTYAANMTPPPLLSMNTFLLHERVTSDLPLQLGGKAKHIHANYSHRANTSSFNIGPDEYSGPVTIIGKGVYGYAVKCTKHFNSSVLHTVHNTSQSDSRDSNKRRHRQRQEQHQGVATSIHLPVIMKVDHAHKHLIWEVVVHSKVSAI